MDMLCLMLSLISLGIIVIVTIILLVQYYRLKGHVESDMRSIVSQVNDVNDYYLNLNNLQNNNIESIDNNLNMIRSQVSSSQNNLYHHGAQMLVTKRPDGTVTVCQPDGSSCRSL